MTYAFEAVREKRGTWAFARTGVALDASVAEDVALLVADRGAPAVAGGVDDSDRAYLGWCAPGEAARTWSTEDGDPSAAEALAAWAERWAPRSPQATDLAALLKRHETFAEHALEAILARLGLVPPDWPAGA